MNKESPDQSYGSRPQYLPDSLRVALAAAEAGISVVDKATHDRLSRESRGLLPMWGTYHLDWTVTTDFRESRPENFAAAEIYLLGLLDGVGDREQVAVFHDNLLVPTLVFSWVALRAHLRVILEEFPRAWLYWPRGRVLVESDWDGTILSGVLPGHPGLKRDQEDGDA